MYTRYIPLSLSLYRMAVTLWSARTPGTAQLERDITVMNNKKKVREGVVHS